MTFPDPEFEAFFDWHYDRMVRTLSAITGDRETARDCVQDAFVKASVRWRRIRSFDDPAAWVRRVAINRSRDVHRAERRRQHRESLTIEVEPTTEETDNLERSLYLADFVEQLPPRQRAVVALFYLDDLPISQIASILGVSDGAVKFHLNRARETLNRLLVKDRELQFGAR